ncbi:aminoglycoside phosphotransferase family protein [Aquabacterium sp.]|uniref:aminoglycoside phosphotransferase family protein n=1 Tax=Aquabacterium sp. TaxID=1872578 RepID=UPI003783BC29
MTAATAPITWPDAAREARFHAWLAPLCQRFGFDAASLVPASADASFRRYFRVRGSQGSFIVMDAPPPQEDVRPFVDIASRIRAAGLHAPEVLAEDAEHGFLLLADLGTTLYLDALQTPAQADALMRDAVRALVQFQQRVDPQGLPAYDTELLQRELSLFETWCVMQEYGHSWTPAQGRQWQRLCELLIGSAQAQPQVAVHRDWMPRNLMVTTPNPGILDFQDAVRGPVTYDIASLLRDAFISWDEDRELDWAVRWWQQARAAGLLAGHAMGEDFGECWRALEWMGLQRHLKVLGIFCRLKHRDGKPRYSADLPRFFGYVARVATRYRELQPLIGLIEPMTGALTTSAFTLR